MRHPILALALAFMAGTTHARADMVYYNMTGTALDAGFQWTPSATPAPFPVAVGDRITWTLQYDRSLPGQGDPQSSTTNYNTTSPTITNIVDRKNGYHRFPTFAPVTSTISPTNGQWKDMKSIFAVGTHGGNSYESYATALELGYQVSLPTAGLRNLQLNNLPLYLYNSYLQYDWGNGIEGITLVTSVNSISSPFTAQAPEPGSLALFLLGAAGLAARGMRRSLRLVG